MKHRLFILIITLFLFIACNPTFILDPMETNDYLLLGENYGFFEIKNKYYSIKFDNYIMKGSLVFGMTLKAHSTLRIKDNRIRIYTEDKSINIVLKSRKFSMFDEYQIKSGEKYLDLYSYPYWNLDEFISKIENKILFLKVFDVYDISRREIIQGQVVRLKLIKDSFGKKRIVK